MNNPPAISIPNLLIVDDDPAQLKYLEILLRKTGAHLIESQSGFDALDKANGLEMALAIVDVKMPGMNGYELARKLNEKRTDDKVPVIFLTANYINEIHVFEGYDSGAVDYISKPVDSRILLCKVNVFLDLFNQKQTVIRDAVLLKKTAVELAKVNSALKKSEEELKSSLEQQHQLAKHIEQVRENERVAISRELHDDLGQALTAIKIDLGIIRQNIAGSEEAVIKITKVSALVSDTIKTVQRLTSQLRPQIIDDLGLEAAIEWYTKEFAHRTGVDVFLDIDSGIAISTDASLNIFRIMQESLTNIARHAKASKVYLELSKTDNFINFTISDNGIGISENEKNSKTSFGILSMKERSASLGGTFKISSVHNHGTAITINLPLNIQGDYENSDL